MLVSSESLLNLIDIPDGKKYFILYFFISSQRVHRQGDSDRQLMSNAFELTRFSGGSIFSYLSGALFVVAFSVLPDEHNIFRFSIEHGYWQK